MTEIHRAEGRRLFGQDPGCYHTARIAYPQKIFDILQARCGLTAGTRTFEIGAGTGLASERLLQLGAWPLVIVEPDRRLANFLLSNLAPAEQRLEARVTTFERVRLTPDWFDLGTSASAFHWLNEKAALIKVARSLRPAGWWAMWWNLFSDGSRTDDFHKVTRPLLRRLGRSPSARKGDRPPFALDTEQRIANLTATNAFENIEVEVISHSAELDTQRMVALCSTFSPISRLKSPERRTLLHKLGQMADNQFGGKFKSAFPRRYTPRDVFESKTIRLRATAADIAKCATTVFAKASCCNLMSSAPIRAKRHCGLGFGWLASGGTHSSHTV